MSKSTKSRKLVILSAGAVIGLSATAIVLLQEPGAPSARTKMIQSALRDGATAVKNGDSSAWVRLAGKPKD
jgi:hypothetical protein